MPQRYAPQVLSNEADIQLAINSVVTRQIQSESRAALTYNVPRMTMRDRRAGKPARRDCQPNLKKLTITEEEVIASYIIELDLRGFAPTYAAVCDIANRLLAARSAN